MNNLQVPLECISTTYSFTPAPLIIGSQRYDFRNFHCHQSCFKQFKVKIFCALGRLTSMETKQEDINISDDSNPSNKIRKLKLPWVKKEAIHKRNSLKNRIQ